MSIPGNFKLVKTIDETNQSLYFSETDNCLYVLKNLIHYDIKVFNYLKTSSNIHVPQVVYFEENNNELSVLEEYIDGMTLEDYLSVNPDLKFDEKLTIVNDLCDGLTYLHKAPMPIIHRDLKSTNIMIDKAGVVKIIDYDAAKTYKLGESRDTVLLGSAVSAAPEQFGFAQSDPRTDIYALGKIMTILFSNEVKNKGHWINKIIAKSTSIDPKDRYQNIRELLDALKNHGKSHTFFPLPGFRNNNLVHMSIAITGYILMALFTVGMFISISGLDRSSGLKLAYCVEFFLAEITFLDLYTDWSGLYSHLPFMKSKNWAVKLPFLVLYTLILVVFIRYCSKLLRLIFI